MRGNMWEMGHIKRSSCNQKMKSRKKIQVKCSVGVDHSKLINLLLRRELWPNNNNMRWATIKFSLFFLTWKNKTNCMRVIDMKYRIFRYIYLYLRLLYVIFSSYRTILLAMKFSPFRSKCAQIQIAQSSNIVIIILYIYVPEYITFIYSFIYSKSTNFCRNPHPRHSQNNRIRLCECVPTQKPEMGWWITDMWNLMCENIHTYKVMP